MSRQCANGAMRILEGKVQRWEEDGQRLGGSQFGQGDVTEETREAEKGWSVGQKEKQRLEF